MSVDNQNLPIGLNPINQPIQTNPKETFTGLPTKVQEIATYKVFAVYDSTYSAEHKGLRVTVKEGSRYRYLLPLEYTILEQFKL